MDNVGDHDKQVLPQDNQVPPVEEVAKGDQILVVPPPMTDGEIRAAFLNFTQAMNSQVNAFTSEVEAMTAQGNREVGPRVPQHANTTVSCLRDFTKINPPIFLGSRSDEDLQDFLDEVYKILYAMGVTSIEKASWWPINSKMWPKLGMHNEEIMRH